jgi:hypothetical protein
MLKTRLAAIASAAAAALLASAGAASAMPTPISGPHAVQAHTLVTGRPDGGNGSPDPYWADDSFDRSITITLTGGTTGHYTYTASLADIGMFTTIKGAQAPNQGGHYAGDVIESSVTGFMTGWADFSFTASSLPDAALVPASENDHGQVPADDTSTWYELAFPAHTVFGGAGIGDWAWGYATLAHQQWADTLDNGYGDLAGDGQITG